MSLLMEDHAVITLARRLTPQRRRTNIGIIGISVLIILVATLSPFRFALDGQLADPAALFGRFLSGLTTNDDIINNLLLFMPLGFGLAGLWHRNGWRAWQALLLTVGCGALLSLTVELAQLFLPGRSPTIRDLLTNSGGSGLGWLIWLAVQSALRSTRALIIGLSNYLLLVLLVSIPAQFAQHLGNWDTSFPLLLGNEQTGDRPWQGQISNLKIWDRAFAPEELSARPATDPTLVADYPLLGTAALRDRSGNLPDLQWQGLPMPTATEGQFTGNQWLSTQRPATALSQRLMDSTAFTLQITASSATTEQAGPARIMSLSGGTSLRNFTLAQEGTALIIRLRTPSSGTNGVYPELRLPTVFTDQRPRQVVVSYNGVDLVAFIDGVRAEQTLRLTPELAMVTTLLPPELRDRFGPRLIYANNSALLIYKLLYYLLVFVPAGLLVTLVVASWQRNLRSKIMLGFALTVGLVCIFELVLAQAGGRTAQFENLLLSGAIVLGVWALASRSKDTHLSTKEFLPDR
jgi:VanZ family protein